MFRPKGFRHLHTIVSTSFDHIEGVLLWNELGVNSPEPYAMAAIKKTLNEKTPFAVTYSSACLSIHALNRGLILTDTFCCRDGRWQPQEERRHHAW